MIIAESDDRLHEHLTLARAFQWLQGALGDPFALVLRSDGQDPAALRARIRAQGPLLHSSTGARVTGDHALGARILADPDLSPRHLDEDGPQEHRVLFSTATQRFCHTLALEDAFLNLDRAGYERLAAVNGPATDAALAAHGDTVRHLHERLLDGVKGEADLVTDYAAPAARAAVGTLLGLREGELDRFAELSRGLAPALDVALCPPRMAVARELAASLTEVRALLSARVEKGPTGQETDLLGGFTRAGSADEATALAMVTAVAGVETLATLVAGTVASLLEHPGQWELVRRDPALAGQAVEETLRYSPPVRLHSLVARRALDLDGEHVPADSHVVVMAEATNRDPAVHEEPDTFDLTRTTARTHLTLPEPLPAGLVGPLARSCATRAVAVLAERHPGLRPAGAPTRHLRSPVTGRFASQPVTL